jgi:hypothetical protein
LDVPVLRPQGEHWVEERTAKVDVTRLPNRMPGFGNRPILEEVPEFTVHVPFDSILLTALRSFTIHSNRYQT